MQARLHNLHNHQVKRSTHENTQNSLANDIANFIGHNEGIAIVKLGIKTHIGDIDLRCVVQLCMRLVLQV